MRAPAHAVDFTRADGRAVEWAVSPRPVPYPAAVAEMEARAEGIAEGRAAERVWLLEHPALYTAGVSAKAADLLSPGRLPVFESGRGQYTYHGPGQRVAYVMLDLRARRRDARAFVAGLEAWIVAALASFGVVGEAPRDRVGVWVTRGDADAARQEKIAAIGVRLRRWVSFHGISLNVAPDLAHFDGIVPCGIADQGVTSLADLGIAATLDEADAALKDAFHGVFGPTADCPAPTLP